MLKRSIAALAMLSSVASAAPVAISQRVIDGEARYSIRLTGSRSDVASRLSSLLKTRVSIAADAPSSLTLKVDDADARAVLYRLADQNTLFLVESDGGYRLQRSEPKVTLDVKDADVRTIMRSVQKQCGIRNLMIDPEVQAEGTFLLSDVPCGAALDVITQSLGLSAAGSNRTVARVSARR